MRTVLILIVTLMALSLQARAEDMQNYLSDTKEMVRQGKHQEALERHIWFHDHALEHDPAMYGVRLSFALGSWKALADVYPPAKKALIETRDRKTEQIKKGEGSFLLFNDVEALNRTLQEENKTVDLFAYLDKENHELAKRCWIVAKDPVIKAKRFDLAKKYVGDLLKEFTKAKAEYDYNTTLYEDKKIGGDHFKKWNEEHLVEESLRLIEVAVALGDIKAAKEIQQNVLEVVDDQRLRDAVQTEGKKSLAVKGNDEGKSTSEAFDVLAAAGCFSDTHVGYAGKTPDEVKAFRTIIQSDNADALFKKILKEGTMAAQLYALCGLYYTDPAFFKEKVEKYKTLDDTVATMMGCTLSVDSVADLVEKDAPNVVRLESNTQTTREWAEKNKEKVKDGMFRDIAGGGWPDAFKNE